ncbi:hypothetical protein [Roseateles sp.]|uniref:hypothetical protein n=1 Tax=Roseateles sp. TaxID=1971397 RepID=UPI003262CF84
MANKKWLVSWIGNADHQASEGMSPSGEGPIATALAGALKFDRVCLLTNYPHGRSAAYCAWLEQRCGYEDAAVDLQDISLLSPIDYPRFTMHGHTVLWKELDAKHASKGLGVLVVKTWYWYQPWLEFVESHCAANAALYS